MPEKNYFDQLISVFRIFINWYLKRETGEHAFFQSNICPYANFDFKNSNQLFCENSFS